MARLNRFYLLCSSLAILCASQPVAILPPAPAHGQDLASVSTAPPQPPMDPPPALQRRGPGDPRERSYYRRPSVVVDDPMGYYPGGSTSQRRPVPPRGHTRPPAAYSDGSGSESGSDSDGRYYGTDDEAAAGPSTSQRRPVPPRAPTPPPADQYDGRSRARGRKASSGRSAQDRVDDSYVQEQKGLIDEAHQIFDDNLREQRRLRAEQRQKQWEKNYGSAQTSSQGGRASSSQQRQSSPSPPPPPRRQSTTTSRSGTISFTMIFGYWGSSEVTMKILPEGQNNLQRMRTCFVKSFPQQAGEVRRIKFKLENLDGSQVPMGNENADFIKNGMRDNARVYVTI